MTCPPPSGTTFAQGVHTVTCVAVDAFDVTSTATFTVTVTAPSASPRLTNPKRLGNGSFQFTFMGLPGAHFTVLASTNVALPLSNWRVLGVAVEDTPGRYQFTDFNAMDYPHRFYCTRCP